MYMLCGMTPEEVLNMEGENKSLKQQIKTQSENYQVLYREFLAVCDAEMKLLNELTTLKKLLEKRPPLSMPSELDYKAIMVDVAFLVGQLTTDDSIRGTRTTIQKLHKIFHVISEPSPLIQGTPTHG